MSETPDQGVESFTVDFERLTAGPSAPRATRAKTRKTTRGRKRGSGTTPAASGNAIVLSPLAESGSTIAALSHDTGNNSVNTLFQNMTTIQDVLSASGLVIVPKDAMNTTHSPQVQKGSNLGAADENVQVTQIQTLPIEDLPIATEMDVAAHQEARSDIQSGYTGIPEQPTGDGKQFPYLVGPFTSADLVPLASHSGVQEVQIPPQDRQPFPISLRVAGSQDLKIIPAANLLRTGAGSFRSLTPEELANLTGSTQSMNTAQYKQSSNMKFVPVENVSASSSGFRVLCNSQASTTLATAGLETVGTMVQVPKNSNSQASTMLEAPGLETVGTMVQVTNNSNSQASTTLANAGPESVVQVSNNTSTGSENVRIAPIANVPQASTGDFESHIPSFGSRSVQVSSRTTADCPGSDFIGSLNAGTISLGSVGMKKAGLSGASLQVTSTSPNPCLTCKSAIVDLSNSKNSNFKLFQCVSCGQMKVTNVEIDPLATAAFDIPRTTNPLECPICWMNFKDQVGLETHQSISHQQPSSFQCSFCSGVFKYQYECEMHEWFTHDKKGTLTCKICSEDFLSKKRMKKHAGKCWDKVTLSGILIEGDKQFKRKTKADGSDKWFTIPVGTTGEKARICKKCGRKFKNLRNYVRHIQNFCSVTSYKCEGCSEEFPTKRKLSEHERDHAGEAHFTCPTCNKQLESKQSFRTHMRLHEGLRPYQCKFCPKGFVTANKCLVHERSHTGERPYVCQICGKEYVMKESLKVHERKHSQDFRFYCKYCKKGFVKKYTHQVHERNHEGHKPFACNYCSKAFARKADCTRHEICTHSTGKEAYRFLCSHCGKAFKLKGDLKVHESIHTGAKSRFCQICQRTFGRTSYYNRHMRLYHTEEQEKQNEQPTQGVPLSKDREDQKKSDAAEALMTVAIGVLNALPNV